MTRELSEREKRFVACYAVALDASRAAVEAGYSPRAAKQTGYKVLQRPHVQAALVAHLKRPRRDAEYSEDYVIAGLKEVLERCLQAEPVLDRQGERTGEYRFDAAGACRALEMLGKHLAMFTDNLNVRDLDRYSDSELDEQIRRLSAEARAAETAH